jgi:hypothetical protein
LGFVARHSDNNYPWILFYKGRVASRHKAKVWRVLSTQYQTRKTLEKWS